MAISTNGLGDFYRRYLSAKDHAGGKRDWRFDAMRRSRRQQLFADVGNTPDLPKVLVERNWPHGGPDRGNLRGRRIAAKRICRFVSLFCFQ